VAVFVLLELVFRFGGLFNDAPPDDLGQEPNPDALRVVALGDSWVDGAEAPDGEGFVDHIGRELGGVLGGREVQLFNLGRTGANSAYVALMALDHLERIQPDLVLVLVGQNNASNFYQVAEVEERLGRRGATRLLDRSRVIKGLRILKTNAQGGSGYRAGDADSLPEVPALVLDDQGQPVVTDPMLSTGAGAAWYRGERAGPTDDDGKDLAWDLLEACQQRDFVAAARLAGQILEWFEWPAASDGIEAPPATRDAEVLARFALLRLAREQRNWRAVRLHGDALLGATERSVLADLGAAEASLLAGDWRSGRAYLMAAHNRAPGLPETIDLAARFPDQARSPDVFEALEYPPSRPLTPPEDARRLLPVFDFEGYERSLDAWTAAHDDPTLRVDLAAWWLSHGLTERADALLGLPPLRREQAHAAPDGGAAAWRYFVLRAAATGEPEPALAAARAGAALEGASRWDPDLLAAVTTTLAAYGACDEATDAGERWYLASADGNGFARALEPCLSPGDAAGRLRGLRSSWGPRGDPESWTALVRAGHKPFELLFRDLDLVVDEAQAVGARVVIVNYPNPSEDHTALRDILGDYASSRGADLVDLWARFEARHDADAWAARLGPNGHCNAAGYREMADGVLEHIGRTGSLEGR